jgi:hypothetical protein
MHKFHVIVDHHDCAVHNAYVRAVPRLHSLSLAVSSARGTVVVPVTLRHYAYVLLTEQMARRSRILHSKGTHTEPHRSNVV